MSLVKGNTVFTSSLDGKVVLWDPVTLSKAMKDVKASGNIKCLDNGGAKKRTRDSDYPTHP